MLFNSVNLKTQVKTPNGSHCDVKSLSHFKIWHGYREFSSHRRR